MSIFESIQAAEKKAEEIRAQATQEVNELIDKTQLESEEKVKLLYAEASSEEKRINAEIEQKVLEKAKEIDALYQKADDDLKALADSRMNQAVEFILGKVFNL
jgi:vacuolar-type H+-ATPase subunit E/Vma4